LELATWQSFFVETEPTYRIAILGAVSEFTAIALHQSILELTLLDMLDVLILGFMVSNSSEIDDATEPIHGRLDLIKCQLSDMEPVFHRDFVGLHDKILLITHVDAADKHVNVAVHRTLFRLDILLWVDLDMSYFLPATQVQMLNIELVDLLS